MKYRIVGTACIVFALAMLMADQPALAFCGFVAAAMPAIGYAAAQGGIRG